MKHLLRLLTSPYGRSLYQNNYFLQRTFIEQERYIRRICSTTTCLKDANPHVRVRFAPSPTGHLHLGGLRTALYNFLFARAHGGRFVLRMEDTDQTRVIPGATEKLIKMLQWSGIEIDEGPGFGGEVGPYVQSERKNIYWDHFQPLLKSGAVYHCFCTSRRLELLKKDALRRGETPKYDNRCRNLSVEEVNIKLESNLPYVIRLKLEPYNKPLEDMVFGPVIQDIASVEGDPVMLKTDGFPTYHYANVVDDHLMGVSHVLRGVEWLPSTMKHVLLYKAFGWTPPKFAHLPLLLNKDGTKLSKRQNDIQVEYLKESGYYPESVLNLLTLAGGGFSARHMTMDEMIKSFDIHKLNSHSTKLEVDRIDEFNRLQLEAKINGPERSQVVHQLKELLTRNLSQRYKSDAEWSHLLEDKSMERVLDFCQSRISRLDDLFSTKLSFVWFVPDTETIGQMLTEEFNVEVTSRILSEAVKFVGNLQESDLKDAKKLSSAMRRLTKKLDTQMKTFMTVTRLSLTGLKEGPAVGEIISLIGKDASLQRLRQCSQALNTSPAPQQSVRTS